MEAGEDEGKGVLVHSPGGLERKEGDGPTFGTSPVFAPRATRTLDIQWIAALVDGMNSA